MWEIREQDLSPAEVPTGLQSLCCAKTEGAETRQVEEQCVAPTYVQILKRKEIYKYLCLFLITLSPKC